MKKLLLLALTMLLLITTLLPFSAKACEYTVINNHIETNYVAATKTLIISGYGEISELYPRDMRRDSELGDSEMGDVISSDEKIKHIIIEEGITRISNSFNDMLAVVDVSLPNSLVEIEFSFINCDNLINLDVPNSVNRIYEYSFSGCDKLKNIKFNGPIIINGSMMWLPAIERVEIPRNSTIDNAFNFCIKLKKAVLGRKVTVGSYRYRDLGTGFTQYGAFYGCHEDMVVCVPLFKMIYYKLLFICKADTFDNMTIGCQNVRLNDTSILLIIFVIVIILSLVLLVLLKRLRKIDEKN